MLFKIAWRNIWRNKRRSLIVISSIIVGVIFAMLNDSLGRGMMMQMLENPIKSHISHIQIHKKGFIDNKNIHKLVPEAEKAETILSELKFIKHYGKRIFVYGLVSSANSSAGAAINGVQPEKEKKITDISKRIIEGTYLTGKKREIVISKKTAEKLEVELGDKVVTVASNIEGDVSNDLFRVVGIYSTSSADFDKMNVFVSLDAAQEMLGLGNNFHEFAIITDDLKNTLNYKDKISERLDDGYESLAYQDLMPMIMTYLESYDQMMAIFYVIIAVAVLFGIVNTMLMSVFERVHEIGVLLSIGMKTGKIFRMVILEAFVLGIFGTIIGLIFGFFFYWLLSIYGIDFSIFSESLRSFGMDNVLYPVMDPVIIINSFLMIPIAAVIGAIYPARKAIKLQPTEAMRYV
jgi:putative ABC transport system permease protein